MRLVFMVFGFQGSLLILLLLLLLRARCAVARRPAMQAVRPAEGHSLAPASVMDGAARSG
jgi:hypothetical protein